MNDWKDVLPYAYEPTTTPEQRQQQRIAALEAQVSRLQEALREMDADYSREVDDETYDDAMMEAALLALQWGDMAPVKGGK